MVDEIIGYGSPEQYIEFIEKILKFYKKKKIKIKFRLLARPEYQFIGLIEKIDHKLVEIKLEKDLALFYLKEVDLNTICPASCNPFTVYQRYDISEELRKKIFNRDNNICQYNFDSNCLRNKGLCVDHIIPVSKGGTNEENNLITSCSICNSKKYNKELKDVIEYLDEEKKKNIMNNINKIKSS